MGIRGRGWLAAAAATMAMGVGAAGAQAETFYGLTDDQRLLVFSTTTGGMVSALPITGLLEGDRLTAIDLHGPSGDLYGVGRTGLNVYVIDPFTAKAQTVPGASSGSATPQELGLESADHDSAAGAAGGGAVGCSGRRLSR